MSKIHNGICHICGKKGELTFEHIPPKKALNWARAKTYNGYEALKKSQGAPAKYCNSQQGMGKPTLCQSCNNNTGAWYAQAYCDFAMDVFKSLYKIKPLVHGDIVKFRFNNCPALQVVKQVVAMFCSLLSYQDVHRLGFDKLLLERDCNTIDKNKFDLRMYLTSIKNGQVMCGPTALRYNKNGIIQTQLVSDLSVYPFGFILNLTPHIPVYDGGSIMEMFNLNYDDKCEFELTLQYLERFNDAFPLPLMFKDLPNQN